MSRHAWNSDRGPRSGLYRDRENGWVFGVCAGLADYMNFRVATVRIIAFLGLFLFFWPAVLLYFVAVFLIRERPLVYCGRDAEYEFWRRESGGERWRHQ